MDKPTETERDAVRQANQALQRWMDKFFYDVSPEQEVADSPRRMSYHYWESPDHRMFCYTPWKDSKGNYFTWVMKPVGKGSLSGKPRQWKQVGKRIRSRKRKTARKRARTRFNNWMEYLAKNELRKPLEVE